MNYFFTSESVSEGHPDKISDQISDALLDNFLAFDPESKVACETLVTTNRIILAGEYRLSHEVNISKDLIENKVREAVKSIGYEQEGFHWKKLKFENFLHPQSSDIAQGVDERTDKPEGAGDQGLMFGYAVDETEHLMPAPLYYSHLILKKLSELRHSGLAKFLPAMSNAVP